VNERQRASGAYITEGPAAWTILQQDADGFADVALQGYWQVIDGVGDYDLERATVYVRVLREDDGRVVWPWEPCRMAEGLEEQERSASLELSLEVGKGRMALEEQERRWSARLRLPAGGLYRLETCLRVRRDDPAMEWPMRGDMIHHLGVGDVWLIAGQSNAAGYGRGAHDDAPEPGVHMLRLNGQWDMASHPLNDPTGTLFAPNREWSNPAHSPFLLFGKLLRSALGYPIGLVPTALGGSHLRSWNPDESGELYRNMREIVGLAGDRVRGVLWYQGCSEACSPETDESQTYLERFEAFVRHLRADFSDDALPLPVLTVQLNRLIGWEVSDALDRCWGRVREAQKEAALRIPSVYIVPSLDGDVCDNIHNGPNANRLIGTRLAEAALAHVYEERDGGVRDRGLARTHARAPRAVAANVRRNEEKERFEIAIKFADVAGRLLAHTTEKAFAVEDESGGIGVPEWQVAGTSEIVLALAREPVGETFVHGAFETNPAYYVPFDDATRWPMLAFYRLSARMQN